MDAADSRGVSYDVQLTLRINVDLVGGQVEIYFGSIPATLPQVKAGKLRMLAATGSRRSQIVPDVLTVTEAA